ncbi:WD40 repeat-like protein [Imleria badia]|nr:WD40 repeat-like protein [Imleria badia]
MGHEKTVCSLAVTRDGTKIISGDMDGRIKVWDVGPHGLVREWTHPGCCLAVAISPNDRLVAVGGGDVRIYTMEGTLVNDSIEVGTFVWSISFCPSGDKLKGHEDLVKCVLWSRDGSRLFSASHDKTIRCWNSDTGEQIGQPWTSHTHFVRSLSISPDGSILASASFDHTVRLWDATSGHPIGQPLQHDERVSAVSFSPSGEFVASADWDGMIYLWRVPWLDSVERRNTVQCAQVSLFLSPPYSMHIPAADQVLDLGFGPTSSEVPNPHPEPPIRDSNTNEHDSLTTSSSSVSDEMDMQYILPHPSLNLDERQRILELRIRKMLDLATSTGLRIPGDLIPSTRASRMDVDWNPTHFSQIEPSTSVFRLASNGDPKKIHKIDKIKQRFVDMLREIGFKLSKGRLPWSTLERDLQTKGYTIVNWPQGVDRDRDKGVSGLSAEDADKLYDALFVHDRRIRLVRCEVTLLGSHHWLLHRRARTDSIIPAQGMCHGGSE